MTKKMKLQVQDLTKAFRAFSVEAETVIDRAVLSGAVLVETAAKRKLTNDRHVSTGALRASITHRMARNESKVTAEIGSNLNYAIGVERGTSPHSVPFAVLKKWAMRKGMSAKVANAVAAYTVLKIRMYGTQPYPFLAPSLDANRNKIYEYIFLKMQRHCK